MGGKIDGALKEGGERGYSGREGREGGLGEGREGGYSGREGRGRVRGGL